MPAEIAAEARIEIVRADGLLVRVPGGADALAVVCAALGLSRAASPDAHNAALGLSPGVGPPSELAPRGGGLAAASAAQRSARTAALRRGPRRC